MSISLRHLPELERPLPRVFCRRAISAGPIYTVMIRHVIRPKNAGSQTP
jgi:hypothetical protein